MRNAKLAFAIGAVSGLTQVTSLPREMKPVSAAYQKPIPCIWLRWLSTIHCEAGDGNRRDRAVASPSTNPSDEPIQGKERAGHSAHSQQEAGHPVFITSLCGDRVVHRCGWSAIISPVLGAPVFVSERGFRGSACAFQHLEHGFLEDVNVIDAH